MKKTLLFLFVILFGSFNTLFGQKGIIKVQGIERPDLSSSQYRIVQNSEDENDPMFDYSSFSFDKINFWVGTGTNKAALIIDWYDGKGSESALVWGYRWPEGETRYGFDMIKDIAKADSRFLFLTHYTGPMGSTICGLGYNLTNSNDWALYFDGNTDDPIYPVDGVVTTYEYNYDSWTSSIPENHWQAGWYNGYWSYQVKEEGDNTFSYSGLGASSRELTDGSIDGWGYQDFNSSGSYSGVMPRMPFVYVTKTVTVDEIFLNVENKDIVKGNKFQLIADILPENAINKTVVWSSNDENIASVDQNGLVSAHNVGSAVITVKTEDGKVSASCNISVVPLTFADGVFFVNEDWYGHNNSSVNYLDSEGQWHYRVYQQQNPGKELGCTSQYGAIYGDKMFIVSKQAQDPGATTEGSRLAVCDAKTMKSLAEFTTIGGADGRSFLGVDVNKG